MQPGKIQKNTRTGNSRTDKGQHNNQMNRTQTGLRLTKSGRCITSGVLSPGHSNRALLTPNAHKKRWIHTHTKWVWNHTREMLPPLRWGMMDYLALRHPVQTTTHWIQNKQNQTKSSHLKMATNKQKRNTKQPLTYTQTHTRRSSSFRQQLPGRGARRDGRRTSNDTITKSKTAAASTHPGQFLWERVENVTATQR